jgi:hypothetical protein
MFKTIELPAGFEIRSVIRFLNARNVKPADLHLQICEVYGENAMSDGMLNGLESSKKVVTTCLTSRGAAGSLWSQTPTFYEEGIQKLVPRYYKYLNNGENYVEKQFKVWRI